MLHVVAAVAAAVVELVAVAAVVEVVEVVEIAAVVAVVAVVVAVVIWLAALEKVLVVRVLVPLLLCGSGVGGGSACESNGSGGSSGKKLVMILEVASYASLIVAHSACARTHTHTQTHTSTLPHEGRVG